MKWLSVIAFYLVVGGLLGEFAEGYFCTRGALFGILPADILYYPAVGLLGLASLGSAILWSWAKYKKKPSPTPGWQWQVYAWLIFAVVFYGGYCPRLGGLALRATTHEEALDDFYAKFRSRGLKGVANHPVRTWSDFDPKIRSTDRFVEISWGATLPGSWGIRICNENRPGPELVNGSDFFAVSAGRRLTVFIGIW